MQLNHKFVIKMLDYFVDELNYYIVMEMPERCMDLGELVSKKGVLSECTARMLFRQILEAVKYCHSKGVAHQDIKLENIIIDLTTYETKLIDFGCGTFFNESSEMFTHYSGMKVFTCIHTCKDS